MAGIREAGAEEVAQQFPQSQRQDMFDYGPFKRRDADQIIATAQASGAGLVVVTSDSPVGRDLSARLAGLVPGSFTVVIVRSGSMDGVIDNYPPDTIVVAPKLESETQPRSAAWANQVERLVKGETTCKEGKSS